MYQTSGGLICLDVSRYMDTFRRHRVGLVIPIVLAVLVAGWYATSRPPKYQSTISLWFDTPVPSASSLNDPSQGSPADNGSKVLQELFASQQFLINVGHRGPLASFLATQSGSGSVDDRIVSVLHTAFTTTVTGPQVVQITMSSKYGSVERGTLSAVAAEYSAEVNSAVAGRDNAQISYYQTQLDAARADLATANQAVAAYLSAHPAAAATNDAQYDSLVQSAAHAQTTYQQLQNNIQTAQIGLQNTNSQASFRVLDPPSAVLQQSTKKKMILEIVAGLLGGSLISLLALNALVSLDKTARRPEDIEGVSGMEVVATIRDLPHSERRPALKGARGQ